MKNSTILTVLALTASSLTFAQAIQDWQFNDDPGTSMDNAANSVVDGASWNFGVFKTDGNHLVIGDAGTDYDTDLTPGQAAIYRAAAIPVLTSGKYVLEARITDWDMDGAGDGTVGNRGISFRVRDTLADPDNNLAIDFESGAAGVRVQSQKTNSSPDATGTAGTLNLTDGLDENTGGLLVLQINVDLDTGMWSTRASTDNGVSWTDLVVDGMGFFTMDSVQFVEGTYNGAGNSISTWEAGEFVLVDSITLSASGTVEPDTWAGWLVDEAGWVDTGSFLGELYVVDSPWIWVPSINTYVYLPEENVMMDGSWGYVSAQ